MAVVRTVVGLVHPTMRCPGSAHENAHTDNCSTCAPEWGRGPAYRLMGDEARFMLRILASSPDPEGLDASGLSGESMLVIDDLIRHGYAEWVEVEERRRGSIATFSAAAITELGRDAVRLMAKERGRVARRRVR